MPEPLSLTLALVGYAALQGLARSESTAVSEEAGSLRSCVAAVMRSAERSIALFGDKSATISELLAISAEHGRWGWDGENARPVSRHAVETAQTLVRCLPEGIPMPEIAPEPDGSLSLDWIYSRTRFVSVSAGTNDRLPYAWIDGTDRGHAVARFDGQWFPPRILDAIRQTMLASHVAIRTA
jgi:hypothetical protein